MREDAGFPVVDVGFFIIESRDENFGGRQRDIQHAVFHLHIFGTEFFHIDSRNHNPVRDEKEFVAEEEIKSALPDFRRDDFFHRVLDGFQPREGADFVNNGHWVRDDGGRGVKQIGDLRLHGAVRLLDRLHGFLRLPRALLHGADDEVGSHSDNKNKKEGKPVSFHEGIISFSAGRSSRNGCHRTEKRDIIQLSDKFFWRKSHGKN